MAYCAQANMEAYFGRDNVRKWADLDNTDDETAIAARITLAIANADGFIDGILRGGPHDIPLTLSPMPTMIVKASVQLAGDDLYTPRGVEDFNADGGPLHKLRGEREDAIEMLRGIHAGKYKFIDTSAATAVPVVIDVETSRDEET